MTKKTTLFLATTALLLMGITFPVNGQELTGWHILSTAHTTSETGATISKTDYNYDHWIMLDADRTSSTVMGALAQTDERGDTVLYYGENLKNVAEEPFNVSWWYRSLFALPAAYQAGDRVRLVLKGVNYRADVWVDGTQVACESDIVGVFRWFELDITNALSSTAGTLQQHCVALRIHRSYGMWGSGLNETELGFTFVDWNPEPADSSMGLLMPVEVASTRGPVSLAHPMVNVAQLYGAVGSYSAADLEAVVVARNWDLDSAVTGTVRVQIGDLASASVAVTLGPNETRNVVLSYSEIGALHVSNPKLWWPYQMGAQDMYSVTFTFETGENVISDTLVKSIGLRVAKGELDANGNRLFSINGRPIVIRGAGFTPDLFARNDATRRARELAYVRDMNLNAVRLEGKFEEEDFYETADRLGLLVLDGWCCGDSWERWKKWQPETHWVAAESLRSQMRRLRAHASVIVFLIGSDFHPTEDVEREYLQVAAEERWPVAILSSATATPSDVSGPTGVKMSGPYSWVPPNYWLIDAEQRQWGGAWGFLTEGGPGENPLLPESVRRTLPEKDWWPINDAWIYHCGNKKGHFGTLDYFTEPLAARYGAYDESLEEFSRRSVAAVYESHRAAFEAFQYARYTATGFIHWMLNNAWPSNIWHLYDYYLTPDSAYFATKKAGEPIHIMFNYANRSVWVVNNRYEAAPESLTATAAVYDINGKLAYTLGDVLPSGVAADSNTPVFGGAAIKGMGEGVPYFVSLSLRNGATGALVSRNVYWLLDTMDVLDWDQSTWYNTPVAKYADFSELGAMASPDRLIYNFTTEEVGDNEVKVKVVVENPSDAIAFMLRARILKGGEDKDDVLPIIWSDNFITLMPGESDVLTATFEKSLLQGETPYLVIKGFNY